MLKSKVESLNVGCRGRSLIFFSKFQPSLSEVWGPNAYAKRWDSRMPRNHKVPSFEWFLSINLLYLMVEITVEYRALSMIQLQIHRRNIILNLLWVADKFTLRTECWAPNQRHMLNAEVQTTSRIFVTELSISKDCWSHRFNGWNKFGDLTYPMVNYGEESHGKILWNMHQSVYRCIFFLGFLWTVLFRIPRQFWPSISALDSGHWSRYG